ncbi:MAG: bifunctional 23S rRNA (guanine(2069)-N(7))-methyltransferase RlmK/23S rRNA (guanine(2445)-N(2))-methyltransferase RlmL [Rhodanobacteraceae bacterium]
MHHYFATCPKGIEYLLRDELTALGAGGAREALAGVHFEGDLATGYRACLWSRLASRILLRLAEFAAPDGDALYAGVQAIDWSEHLAADGSLAVDAVGSTGKLRHTQYVAQRVKDAIADQFRGRCGMRPDVDLQRPSIRLNLFLRRDRASLSLDFAGTPLHRHGWRVGQGDAPLKENLACAILLRGGWPAISGAGGALVDPMCGAGTLLVEGALMAADSAPGINREYFGFFGWRGHDAALWQSLLDEAHARAEAGMRSLAAEFFGYDADTRVLAEARRNVETAGLAQVIRLAPQPMDRLEAPAGQIGGLVVCNPPYGERLGERAQLTPLYRSLGERLRAGFAGWHAAIITADRELARDIGLHPRKRYVLYNGALECHLLVCDITDRHSRPRAEPVRSPGITAVANRIGKNARRLRKRLQREAIGCYRVYDADMPEYSAAIDVYTAVGIEKRIDATRDSGTSTQSAFPQTWLHLQEYAAPRTISAHDARVHLGELVRATSEVFDVPRARIAVKTRRRSRGGGGHGQFEDRGEFLIVEEGGLRLRVNLFDHLDTGLFLDHRPTRARLRARMRGLRFLNLFCYTASATVHAAAGGAIGTTSVDLSLTYLDWAERNLALNGFTGPAHRLIHADALQWLVHDHGEYDLIFVDPPTFSNSKRTEDFDVQRDHVALLRLCGDRLAAGGTIVFSVNSRRFRIDRDALADFVVEDVTAASIPFDFSRNPRIHQCHELQWRGPTIS